MRLGRGVGNVRAGGSVPLAGNAGLHAQVSLEFFLREPKKQVSIYLLLLEEKSDKRKERPPLQHLDPTLRNTKGRDLKMAVEEADGTQMRTE